MKKCCLVLWVLVIVVSCMTLYTLKPIKTDNPLVTISEALSPCSSEIKDLPPLLSISEEPFIQKEKEEERLKLIEASTNFFAAGNSNQKSFAYAALRNDVYKQSTPNENGLLMFEGYYCVAMGSYYTRTIGDLFRITTETGTFDVIICDQKSDRHTDVTHRYSGDGSWIEFYVNKQTLDAEVRYSGNVGSLGAPFEGNIILIEKIGNFYQ